MSTTTSSMPRLKAKYNNELRAQLKDTLGLSNIMEVPRFEKIVLNAGVGRATVQPSLLEGAITDLTKITGQKPTVARRRSRSPGSNSARVTPSARR